LARVLEKGASFFDAMSALVEEGLYRPDAPLVEVYFNFIRPQALKVRGLEIVQAGTGYSDLDLMVTIASDLNHLRLDYNLDIIGEQDCVRFGQDYLELLAEIASGAQAQAGPAPVPVPVSVPTSAAPASASATAASVALAATFALGDLTAMLETALEDEGTTFTVATAPYHQALAALQDPAGVFAQSTAAVGVVLLRAADLARFGPVSDELLSELADEYPAALRSLHERTGLPMIVGFLPARSADDRLLRWERELAARLRSAPGLAVLSPESWGHGFDVAEPFDEETDALAHLPFSPSFQAAVALTAADLVRAVRRTPPKVIAVDGDETLWGGVAGEIGPDAVDLTGPRDTLARRLLEWRAAGVLLALVSNNDEATVLSVLERPDSRLRAEHFSAVSATWGPKAARLEAIADGLGLGLDSFLFLDDNPVEIAAMRSQLPEVLCVTCPPASELDAFVTRLWPVTPKAATREDAARADFYRQERLRTRERERSGFLDFLERLRLEVDIRPLSAATIERSAQLSRRTNQFNLRPEPLDEAALTRWQLDGEVWTASVSDRFGDYGQVGVLVLRRDGNALEVAAWMLSCRALGRGVEERLLQWLADRAETLGCETVRLIAENTPRNVPARRLVAALGGGEVDDPRLDVAAPLSRLRTFRSWDEDSDGL
ncbi:MAG TPA: HAD-IIIC family phosphatase, partial [Actinocrinis sp.]|uniref:HAD-IIIC family phosphatase n=1 Tax=Actinocrinis sp. TaxID=1920516 RepID=UPI002DDD55D5